MAGHSFTKLQSRSVVATPITTPINSVERRPGSTADTATAAGDTGVTAVILVAAVVMVIRLATTSADTMGTLVAIPAMAMGVACTHLAATEASVPRLFSPV